MEKDKQLEPSKVLIILYYWPPAGGPGVQRWLNFVKHLPDNGIEPIVYYPSNPNYPIIDESLISEIPEGLTVLKKTIKEPYRFASFLSKTNSKKISSGIIPKSSKQSLLQRLMLFIRGNYFIPDARKNWVKPSIDYLQEKIEELKIETIITTGPPHSLHLIGLELKSKLGVKWITDFRDPWTTIGYHKKLKLSKSSQIRHRNLEKKVLNSADRIIVTSFHTKKEFSEKSNVPISVITNGYNAYEGIKVEKSSQFSIAHVGSLLSERNPKALWGALSELRSENAEFQKHMRLDLYGVVSEEIIETLQKFELEGCMKYHGYVSHKEAMKAQRKSRLLLLIEIDSEDTKAIIPGKLFEYMSSKTPILAIGPKESDVETLLYNSSAGNYFSYEQKDLIKTQLLLHYKDFKMGNLESRSVNIEQYQRKELTKILASIIGQCHS